MGWNAIIHDVVVLRVTLSVRTEAVKLSCRMREEGVGVEPKPARRLLLLLFHLVYPEAKPFDFPMNQWELWEGVGVSL